MDQRASQTELEAADVEETKVSPEAKEAKEAKEEAKAESSEPYMLPFVSLAAVVVVYLLGRWGFSALWVLLLAIWFTLRSSIKDLHASKASEVKFMRNLHDPHYLKAFMKVAPTWTNFSEKEKANWFNNTLRDLWPYAKTATEDSVKASVSPLLDYYRPGFLNTLEFDTLDLGPYPPTIRWIRSVPAENGTVVLDMEIKMDTNTNIVLKAGVIRVHLADLEVAGYIRLTLNEPSDDWPCFAALTFGFTQQPDITFKLKGLGLPLSQIPGLASFLNTFLGDTLAGMLVYPKKWPVAILDIPQHVMDDISAEEPTGLLRVVVRRAENLQNKELMGTSDPLCKLTVGAQTENTSKQDNTLDPEWNQAFTFVTHDRSLQSLDINVIDNDISSTKELGKLSIKLNTIKPNDYKASWNRLARAATGRIQIETLFNPVLSAEDVAAVRNDKSKSFLDLNGGLLIVTVHKCHGLETRDNGIPPMVQLSIAKKSNKEKKTKGGETAITTVWPESTTDPVYHEKLFLFLQDIESQVVKVRVGLLNEIEVAMQEKSGFLGLSGKQETSHAMIELSKCRAIREGNTQKLNLDLSKGGSVKLSLKFKPVMRTDKGPGKLKITIHSAKGFALAARSGGELPNPQFDIYLNNFKKKLCHSQSKKIPDGAGAEEVVWEEGLQPIAVHDWEQELLRIQCSDFLKKTKSRLISRADFPVAKVVLAPYMRMKEQVIRMGSIELVVSLEFTFENEMGLLENVAARAQDALQAAQLSAQEAMEKAKERYHGKVQR